MSRISIWYIKRGKVSVCPYVYNAGLGANDVIMRIAGLVAAGDMVIGNRHGLRVASAVARAARMMP